MNHKITTLSLIAIASAFSSFAVKEKPKSDLLLRGNFDNCRLVFEKEKKGHAAFMGGSITEMNGYRPILWEWLQKRFPKTEFTFTNAGISSTCSTTHTSSCGSTCSSSYPGSFTACLPQGPKFVCRWYDGTARA